MKIYQVTPLGDSVTEFEIPSVLKQAAREMDPSDQWLVALGFLADGCVRWQVRDTTFGNNEEYDNRIESAVITYGVLRVKGWYLDRNLYELYISEDEDSARVAAQARYNRMVEAMNRGEDEES